MTGQPPFLLLVDAICAPQSGVNPDSSLDTGG
jgi:hypothetical protein